MPKDIFLSLSIFRQKALCFDDNELNKQILEKIKIRFFSRVHSIFEWILIGFIHLNYQQNYLFFPILYLKRKMRHYSLHQDQKYIQYTYRLSFKWKEWMFSFRSIEYHCRVNVHHVCHVMSVYLHQIILYVVGVQWINGKMIIEIDIHAHKHTPRNFSCQFNEVVLTHQILLTN
jgi:hypothetical protein